ncbi:MAG TPA: IPTL-CTERM sorting domain-containing protein [Thermoanaerobaculia bacterium]|nr:IPTL-CTERM sorting domain-containing protein [Thermoanaerobaculia bacterium]
MSHPRSVVAVAALALGLAGASAVAEVCDPASTPCQHCPSPPPCTPSNTCPFFALGPPGTYAVASWVSCAGSFSQVTATTTSYIGPADLCVGADRSVGCHVPPGTKLYDSLTERIAARTAATIPTLSVWALGSLAAGLGALALRRLRPRPPTP